MERPRYGKRRALFPTHRDLNSSVVDLIFELGVRLPSLRRFVLAWPPSRLRTFVIANYMFKHASAWNVNELSRVMRGYSPEIDFRLFGGLGSFRGHEGVREATATWREAFPNVRLVLEKWIELTRDLFVTIVRMEGSGAASGINWNQQAGIVWTLEKGFASSCVWHATKAEALEAVGLSE